MLTGFPLKPLRSNSMLSGAPSALVLSAHTVMSGVRCNRSCIAWVSGGGE